MQRNMYSPKHRLNRPSFATTSALHCRSKTRTHTARTRIQRSTYTARPSHTYTLVERSTQEATQMTDVARQLRNIAQLTKAATAPATDARLPLTSQLS